MAKLEEVRIGQNPEMDKLEQVRIGNIIAISDQVVLAIVFF